MKKIQDQRQPTSRLPDWNGYMSDLSSMKITKEELARKVASRQSSNLALARAEMLQKSRDKANPKPFTPAVSAQLRASSSKTLDDALADSTAALALARRVKEEGIHDPITHYQEPNIQAFSSYYQPYQEACEYAEVYSSVRDVAPRNLQSDPSTIDDFSNGGDFMALANPETKSGIDPLSMQLPLTEQGWQNLNNTIQVDLTLKLVVKTCEALWLQLEDEQINRERLHHQLQEQKNAITTLTAELLQVKDHQDTILRELHTAKGTGMLSGSAFAPPGSSASGGECFQPANRYQVPPAQPPAYCPPEASQRFRSAPRRTGRTSPRPLAYSDSSLNTPDMPPRMQLNHGMGSGSPAIPRRDVHHLRYQGKSKSATQLDSGQEKPNYEKELASNVALLRLTKNYQISD